MLLLSAFVVFGIVMFLFGIGAALMYIRGLEIENSHTVSRPDLYDVNTVSGSRNTGMSDSVEIKR